MVPRRFPLISCIAHWPVRDVRLDVVMNTVTIVTVPIGTLGICNTDEP